MREATFRSSAFNTSEAKPSFINPCCFGDDLARWMMVRLRAAGVKADEQPGQGDFGWYFNLETSGGRHCCILAYQEDDREGLWHLSIERSRGFVGSVLGLRHRGIDPSALEAIQNILSASEIRELDWQML